MDEENNEFFDFSSSDEYYEQDNYVSNACDIFFLFMGMYSS